MTVQTSAARVPSLLPGALYLLCDELVHFLGLTALGTYAFRHSGGLQDAHVSRYAAEELLDIESLGQLRPFDGTPPSWLDRSTESQARDAEELDTVLLWRVSIGHQILYATVAELALLPQYLCERFAPGRTVAAHVVSAEMPRVWFDSLDPQFRLSS